MPAPIFVDFVVRGMPEFQRALKTVADSVARTETAGTRASATGARVRTSIADREVKDKIRAMQKADRAVSQARMNGLREAEKVARAESMMAERSARDRVRAMQRADSIVKRIQEQSVRDTEKAEAQKNAESMRWVRKQERGQQFAQRRAVETIGGAAANGFRSGIGRAAQATQQVAGTVLGLGGGFSVADSVQRASSASGLAADIANSGWMPNTKPGDALYANNQKRSSRSVLGAARATAVKTGLGTDDVLGGLREFVGKSGDLDTGLKVMDELSVLARATGANFKDVAGAAGDLMGQLGDMPDKGKAVTAIMRGIAGQGKLGAVEMRNMASQMAKLAASAGQFGGNAVDNILKMGMLAQEARAGGGAASATMAATSVTGFVNTLKTPARIAAFKAQGINVFDDDKMLRAPEEIIMQSLQKTGGDPEKMKAMFANIMGERAVTSYANAYRKAEGVQKGSGTGVVQGMFNKQLNGATMSKDEVARAFSDRMQETDAQFASMREQFDAAVEQQLIPELMKLVPVIKTMIPVFIDLQAKALPAFVSLIKSIADFAEANKGIISSIAAHPIGFIMAAEVSKSIAAAGLGEVIKRLLMGGGSGGGGGAGGAGAGKYLPVVGGAIAAGTGISSVITKAGTNYADGQMASDDMLARVQAWQRGDTERGMSPAAAAKKLQEAQGRLDAGSTLGTTDDLISSLWNDESSKKYDQTKSDQGLLGNEKLVALIAALDRNTAATSTNSSATGGNPAKTLNQGASSFKVAALE